MSMEHFSSCHKTKDVNNYANPNLAEFIQNSHPFPSKKYLKTFTQWPQISETYNVLVHAKMKQKKDIGTACW